MFLSTVTIQLLKTTFQTIGFQRDTVELKRTIIVGVTQVTLACITTFQLKSTRIAFFHLAFEMERFLYSLYGSLERLALVLLGK